MEKQNKRKKKVGISLGQSLPLVLPLHWRPSPQLLRHLGYWYWQQWRGLIPSLPDARIDRFEIEYWKSKSKSKSKIENRNRNRIKIEIEIESKSKSKRNQNRNRIEFEIEIEKAKLKQRRLNTTGMTAVYPWMYDWPRSWSYRGGMGEVGETWLAVWLLARAGASCLLKTCWIWQGFRTHHHPSNSCHASNGSQRVFGLSKVF